MDTAIDQAIEQIYQSLNNDNEDLDEHIESLKSALAAAGSKEAVFKPSRLAQGNRSGRKLMQSYFRKRGVVIAFAEQDAA
jgi:cell division septum initiation protein DivIVA